MELNELLKRQIKNHLGEQYQLPASFISLFRDVSLHYDQFETDYGTLNNCSKELDELRIKLNNETEEAFKAHNELKTLFESIEEVYFSVDMLQNKIFQMSSACENVYGFPAEDFYNNADLWKQVILEEDLDIISENAKIMFSGVKISTQYRIYHADGTIRWLETKINPTLNNDGIVTRIDGVTSDITERKNTEEALVLSEKRFRNLIENNEDGITLLDKDNIICYQSPGTERMLGFTIEERKGNSGLKYIHPEDAEDGHKIFDLAKDNPGVVYPFQYRKLHKDGHYVWVEGTIINMFENKSVNAIVANFRDITQRKIAEKKISETENKFRNIFENMLDGVYKSSHGGKFIEVNPALVKMLGYSTKEEVMNLDIKTELYFEASERDEVALQDLDDGIDVYRLKKKDGTEIWVEDRCQFVYDEDGNVLYHEGNLRDVTKRMEAEIQLFQSRKELEQKERKYRALIENSADMISMMDANGQFIYASPEVQKMFGFTNDEILSMNAGEITHPDDLSKTMLFFQDLMQNPGVPLYGPIIRNVKKDGTYIWVEGTITNLLNLKGVNAIVANFRDITERKVHQDAIINSNNELRKRNLELDKFVYSVSHDLRAPLLSMKGIINITQEETREDLTSQHMQLLNGSIQRLDNFIAEILEYSRNSRSEIKKDIINFKDMMDEISSDLNHAIDNSIKIEMQIEEAGNFCSDKRRISVVLHNLISNAINYNDPESSEPFVKIIINSDHDNTSINVEDNGIGISEENQSKIFDMFYRVSEKSTGSGLGLYIVKETIEKLNGNISVESTPGVGTKFSLKFPNLFFQ